MSLFRVKDVLNFIAAVALRHGLGLGLVFGAGLFAFIYMPYFGQVQCLWSASFGCGGSAWSSRRHPVSQFRICSYAHKRGRLFAVIQVNRLNRYLFFIQYVHDATIRTSSIILFAD